MATITERISDMYAVAMLGLEPEEYKHLAILKAQEIDLSGSDLPEVTIACSVFTDRLNEMYTRDLVSKSFGSNKEIERAKRIFTDTYNIRKLRTTTASQIRSRHSDSIENPYNDFVGLLEEIYLYGLDKQYSEDGIRELHRCFANDFYRISGSYLSEYGINDLNTKIQTRRLPVDGVVELVKKGK